MAAFFAEAVVLYYKLETAFGAGIKLAVMLFRISYVNHLSAAAFKRIRLSFGNEDKPFTLSAEICRSVLHKLSGILIVFRKLGYFGNGSAALYRLILGSVRYIGIAVHEYFRAAFSAFEIFSGIVRNHSRIFHLDSAAFDAAAGFALAWGYYGNDSPALRTYEIKAVITAAAFIVKFLVIITAATIALMLMGVMYSAVFADYNLSLFRRTAVVTAAVATAAIIVIYASYGFHLLTAAFERAFPAFHYALAILFNADLGSTLPAFEDSPCHRGNLIEVDHLLAAALGLRFSSFGFLSNRKPSVAL